MDSRLLAAGAAAALFLGFGPGTAGATDVSILGCNEGLLGEVGIRELLGDVGDTVGVAVTVHTTGNVDAFVLDVTFPTGLLSYVRTDPGSLTAGFPPPAGNGQFSGFAAGPGVVRVGGLNPIGIPGGTMGGLAVVWFEIIAAGTDSFSTGNYLDDLVPYTACEDAHGPTHIPLEAWGKIKALYKD